MGSLGNTQPAGGQEPEKLSRFGRWINDKLRGSTQTQRKKEADEAAAAEKKLLAPLPPGPDATDKAVRAAAAAETQRALAGRGRSGSFLTGSAGAGAARVQRKTLLGG